ncbi:MAG TPA: filamentous hemagglutinin N-terminal domain-containing protein, partial [Gammaproteobacteria bacterium]|nr:filamentous hemagglutinin N-terminal domain-containing protein [Gammaproteobacteria bacterium]
MNHHKSGISSLLASLRAALAEARHPARLGALGLGALAPLAALANPTGGQVVGGTATISTPSANGTVINQGSQRAVINWQQFSVGANQYVQFVQPSSSAVVLNRVIGSNPSSIFGNITANGQVFLVNPNGILFAPGATLDVAGLVASTLDVSDADFMQGNYVFSRGSSATPGVVQNQGSIVAGSGGYVVLAGDYVENDGHIDAQSGRVYLAAGNSATLTFDKNQLISYTVDGATLARLAGVSNTGEITADGGAVVMTADVGNALVATAVNNSGFVAAHSIRNESGEIVLSARGGDIDNSGTLDASATDPGVAGGTVILRGNGATRLTPTSVIDAGGDGAQGGFVELSGHHLAVRGDVNLGHGGNLLLDPAKLFITAGSSKGGSITSGDFVGEHFIDAQLNAGVNVVLVASNSIAAGNPGGVASGPATAITALTGAGNLTIKTGTLTLHSGTAGHGSLMNVGANSLNCGQGVCKPYGSAATLSEIFAATSGTINLTGIAINIKGAFTANASQGAVTLGPVNAKAIAITGGTITIGGNLTASAGNLSIHAHHGPATAATITATGTVLTGKAVSISASGSYGGKITLGDVMATGGSITIHADDTSLVSNSAAITAGNLTGKAVNMLVLGPVKTALNVGAINADRINISASGKSDTIVTGALTASSAAGPADITIRATENGGGGAITINGNITVSGKPAATNLNTHPFDLPLAAGLDIENLGSGNGARMVKVNGSITATAHAGAYTADSHQEAGVVSDRKQSGTGGVAGAFLIVAGSGGAASVTGSIAAKGPDAHVGMVARTVSVGNISVTGSGHSITRTIVDSTKIPGGG